MAAEDKNKMTRWMLPEGIEETLPERANVLEQVRRRLLDFFSSCGYELVMTPFIEYLDALLAGAGKELGAQTFQITDALSGRQLGIRADMTLQAARMDAHQIKQDGPVRLCYIGTVLHTVNDGFAGSRAPLQVGAELYGHAGIESDFEILELMLDMLAITGIRDVHIDLGHVGIFRSLAAQAGLDSQDEQILFDALQRKAVPEIRAILDRLALSSDISQCLSALADLNGGTEVLERAEKIFQGADAAVLSALDEIKKISALLQSRMPELPVHYDLAELRGYAYKTGMVFAAFIPGYGQEIARGGRYDEIGSIFGRARPATGFSADLKTLMQLSAQLPAAKTGGIFAPADDDQSLREMINVLRKQGERVIVELPGQQGGAVDMGCDRSLSLVNGNWQVVPV
jgi:ATP phosphoribosyltransferase regulatory subunit